MLILIPLGGFAALTFSVAIIWFSRAMAFRWQLVDVAGQDPLKIHQKATPFVGGIGIAWGTIGGLIVAAAISGQPLVLLGSLSIPLTISVGMHFLGLWDDRARLSPLFRLLIEFLAAAAFATLASPACSLVMALPLPESTFILLELIGVIFLIPATINAVNMFDGMDGMAGGVALISAIGCLVIGCLNHCWLPSILAAALAGAILGFLVFNFHPASVFMGDNGSYFLGSLLAVLAVSALEYSPPSLTKWLGICLLLGLPLLDAIQVILRRLARGVPPFQGDRNHVYDLLHQRGLSFRGVAFLCYFVQLLLVGLGVILLA